RGRRSGARGVRASALRSPTGSGGSTPSWESGDGCSSERRARSLSSGCSPRRRRARRPKSSVVGSLFSCDESSAEPSRRRGGSLGGVLGVFEGPFLGKRICRILVPHWKDGAGNEGGFGCVRLLGTEVCRQTKGCFYQ